MTRNAKKLRGPRSGALLGALVALAIFAVPASALGAPVLSPRVSHYPPSVPAGTYVKYDVAVSNTGDATTSAPITMDIAFPAGLRVTRVSAPQFSDGIGGFFASWTCTTAPDAQSARCALASFLPIGAAQEACVGSFVAAPCRISVIAKLDSSVLPGTLTPTFRACGGGAVACTDVSDPTVTGPPAFFDLTGFDGGAFDELGNSYALAGGSPDTAATDFHFTEELRADGLVFPTEALRDVIADLPPGFVGNPQAVPTCTVAELQGSRGALEIPTCPNSSQVGLLTIYQDGGLPASLPGYVLGVPKVTYDPVYNMVSPRGTPAVFGINSLGVLITVAADVRTGSDYGVRTTSRNAPISINLEGVGFTVWGVPGDPARDADRGFSPTFPRGQLCAMTSDPNCRNPFTAPVKPFISLPTSCTGSPIRTDLTVTTWAGSSRSASFLSHDINDIPEPISGCNALDFRATLKARPTTNLADSPSGLEVDLQVPQNNDTCRTTPTFSCGTATAHLRDTTVVLPEGLNVNPSSANGLSSCSTADIGLTSAVGVEPITYTPDPARCPDASKLGTVSVETPLLRNPVPGAVYLATPHDNPFDSLLALYIAINDAETGIVVKLAGEVSPDPVTGQLTTTFENNPQLPFEHFFLDFFGGAGGSLRTPAVCGDYATNSALTPWSGTAPVDSPDPWQITQGPNGAPCANSDAERSNSPSFDAGAQSPIANAYSPFVVNLRRDDATQEFSAVTVSPPPGLVAKLAGTQICSADALAAAEAKTGREEQASPSCPAASEVGSVNAAAGAGPAPYNAKGKVYMSGPYKGAPLSMATIVPATAGPFDLGTVVTKIPVYVNSKTAEITAKADPVPHILQGIPLDIRSIHVVLDKPQFTLNPTNCDPMAVNGELTSTLGAVAPLSSRFQLGECAALGFKPNLILTLRGGTKRGKHPALTATLIPRSGDANIKSVSVAFPRSEFLENAHIRTICTRPDFAADNCPAGAIYGESTVDTPLLDYDLSGHVYLRSSDNLLPDLVPDLRGPAEQPIRIEAAGRTDSIRGGIRNTFDFFPDAPFTKAVVSMQGGSKGLLVNSRDICGRTYRATVKYTAHNGLTYTAQPKLRAQCGGKAKRGGRAKRAGHRR